MKNLVTLLFACLIALIVSCSSVYDVGYDYDQETNFAGLKTYDWLPVPEGIKVDTLVQERIKNAVNSGLEAKGLRMTSDTPDFLIAMQTMRKERESYAPQSSGYTYGPRWHGPRYSKYTYEEGTLVLDFVDPASKKLIWRGTAKGVVDSKMTPEKIDELVNEAVQKILKNFPPPAPK
ncbi:MAG: DUF4136 domain-containing protein [Syntrophobacteria bacterium]|jgi:hypothetical protein